MWGLSVAWWRIIDMNGMFSPNNIVALKVPLDKCHNIFSFHFPLNMFNPTSTGHCSLTACDLAIIYHSFHSVKKDTLYPKSAYLILDFVSATLIISNVSRRRKYGY